MRYTSVYKNSRLVGVGKICVKPGLHVNANRTRMRTRHVKTKRMFDVDNLPRRGKQHSAVRWTFDEQPSAISRLLIPQGEFTYDTLSIRCLDECQTVCKSSIHSASSHCHMPCSHLCSDVNPALQDQLYLSFYLRYSVCHALLRQVMNHKISFPF